MIKLHINGTTYTVAFGCGRGFIRDAHGNPVGQVLRTLRRGCTYWKAEGTIELYTTATAAAYSIAARYHTEAPVQG